MMTKSGLKRAGTRTAPSFFQGLSEAQRTTDTFVPGVQLLSSFPAKCTELDSSLTQLLEIT